MASSLLSQHRSFFSDEVSRRPSTFEPFAAQPSESLYTSAPTIRDTSLYPRTSDSPPYTDDQGIQPPSSGFLPHNPSMNHHVPITNPLYQQHESLPFHGPTDLPTHPAAYASSAFPSNVRGRPHAQSNMNGALSHRQSVSTLYGPDLGFQVPSSDQTFAPLQQPDHTVHPQSSHMMAPNGISEHPFESYDYDPAIPRGIRHQSSFSTQSSRSTTHHTNGSIEPTLSYNTGNSGNNHAAPSFTAVSNGPTLRDTLRDAREPRDASVDGRGASGRDGGSGGEEISTIFVVGFPDDMQEREFQNMFTFSRGFEAATLKIPNKDSTAYNGATNTSLNSGASVSGASNAASSDRRGTGFGGANDPYNLVTVNSGGVVVDARDLSGAPQTSATWPNGLTPGSASSSTDDRGNYGSASAASNAAGGTQSQAQPPPRKQIIGFAKFATRADALHARDVLQSKRVDMDKPAVLKAEMAKKNLHTKRGVGGAQSTTTTSGGNGQHEAGTRGSNRDSMPPSNAYTTANLNLSGIPLVNGNGAIASMGSLSQVHNGSIASDLHHSFSASVREREQAALAALGVSSTLGGQRPYGPMPRDHFESDLDERLGRHPYRPHPDAMVRGSMDSYHTGASLSGGSSVSSFSPELASAPRNIPMLPLNAYPVDALPNHMLHSRTMNGENDVNATPVAHPSRWPPHFSSRDGEENRGRDDLRGADATEARLRSESRDSFAPSSRSASRSQSRSAHFQSSSPLDNVLQLSHDDGGAGDMTLVAPDRALSRTVVQSEPSVGDPAGMQSASGSGSPGLQLSLSSVAENDIGPWPRPASAFSGASLSHQSSGERLSSPAESQSHDSRLDHLPQQHGLTSLDSSSRGSGSPAEIQTPHDIIPMHGEGGDHLSPLHHIPLNALPRLPSQYTQYQPRANDLERNGIFNEAIFDSRGVEQRKGDLGGLETRFGDFSLGAAGSATHDTSPPITSPPLSSMSSGHGGRGNNDIRGNIDQNPPINTLYVGNLPTTASSSTANALLEESLRVAFSKCAGFRKLCFRQKSNGPMCFVEFDDVQFATQAMHDMYGNTLNGLIKNGIRLSYSKNPLGVRSPTLSNGSNLPSAASFHSLHDGPPSRHASVDAGRFGSKGSYFVDANAPPRRQQLREEQDHRMISNPFDGTVIGPRAMRQMSVSSGLGGGLGDYFGANNGPIDHSFNGVGGGFGQHSATSPPPRLAPRYFSAAPGDNMPNRSAFSPVHSPVGAGSTSSASGFGSFYSSSDFVSSPPLVPAQSMSQQLPSSRSTFSPFGSDMFGPRTDIPMDDNERFERGDSLVGHFGGNGRLPSTFDDGGSSATLYNSNAFAPMGSNGMGEQR